MIIKILGSGCKNCVKLAENTETALKELNLSAVIEKVTDFAEISKYGVMSTPALVVDGKVKSFGKVLKPKEVAKILEKAGE
ncbi:MAG: thioredoxin family protein [Eubacteriales bacterium]